MKRSSEVRRAYDLAGRAYADRLYGELAHKAFDRNALDRMVEKARHLGPILDIGCGPGQVARYLKDRGADTQGIDLSDGMIAQARRLNPDLKFTQGDMRTLTGAEDSKFGGIVAAYAIVNLPDDQLPSVFREFNRILKPNGVLLLSFHVGDEVRHISDLCGVAAELDFFFYQPEAITRMLTDAHFVIDEAIERDPYPEVEVQTRRAYLFCHSEKPQ